MLFRSVMNRQCCARLLSFCWVVSVVHTMLHVGLLLPLSWSADAEGNIHLLHFFCDHRPLLRASCSDIHPNELAIFLEGGFLMMGPCALIVLSYVRTGATILRLPSAAGRRRAVSTCGSHLTMVGFFYVPERRSSSSAPRRDSAEPRPRGCSGLGEPRPALPSF